MATKHEGKDAIIDAISKMNVLELAELVKTLEEKFDVQAQMPVAVVPGGAGAQAAAPAEEKTEFNVILANMGANKIPVIKVVREITSLGLKEAKELVESAPKPVKEGVDKKQAEEIKNKLTEVGAIVEIE